MKNIYITLRIIVTSLGVNTHCVHACYITGPVQGSLGEVLSALVKDGSLIDVTNDECFHKHSAYEQFNVADLLRDEVTHNR